jgi:putative sigma-54 modulation protein
MDRILGGTMDIRFTARHCTISDAMRRRAQERLEALTRFEPTLASTDVLFSLDHGAQRVEARLHCRGQVLQASAGGDGFQIALDACLERAERQLRRRRDRITDHKVVAPPAA